MEIFVTIKLVIVVVPAPIVPMPEMLGRFEPEISPANVNAGMVRPVPALTIPWMTGEFNVATPVKFDTPATVKLPPLPTTTPPSNVTPLRNVEVAVTVN